MQCERGEHLVYSDPTTRFAYRCQTIFDAIWFSIVLQNINPILVNLRKLFRFR